MKIILDKNENSYYLDKICNVKAPCVCLLALSLHVTLEKDKDSTKSRPPPDSAVESFTFHFCLALL